MGVSCRIMNDNLPTEETAATLYWAPTKPVELRNCWIVIDSGPDAGKKFGPLAESTTVGRATWADIGLSDPQVSKNHFRLSCTPRGVVFEDLKSTNGVAHNGMILIQAVFTQDTALRIGGTELRIVFGDGTRRAECPTQDPSRKLVGSSPQMRDMFRLMERVAHIVTPVLLLGETGTGKSTVAKALHDMGPRKNAPFVVLTSPELTATLAESELFGHVRGAFTGATSDHCGVFERADGGTVFLDEIGDLPLNLQSKLLGVIDRRTVRRVGSGHERVVDFRLICATHRDLREEVDAGRFREDLFYRIGTLDITVPPLREHPADISMLIAWHLPRLLGRFSVDGRPVRARTVSPEAMSVLVKHFWPGNVRQLLGVLERAIAFGDGPDVKSHDLELRDADERSARPTSGKEPHMSLDSGKIESYKDFKTRIVRELEEIYVRSLMELAKGNVSLGSELADMSRSYLREIMARIKLVAGIHE